MNSRRRGTVDQWGAGRSAVPPPERPGLSWPAAASDSGSPRCGDPAACRKPTSPSPRKCRSKRSASWSEDTALRPARHPRTDRARRGRASRRSHGQAPRPGGRRPRVRDPRTTPPGPSWTGRRRRTTQHRRAARSHRRPVAALLDWQVRRAGPRSSRRPARGSRPHPRCDNRRRTPRRLGRGRRAALFQLAAEVPAPILAELLGLSITTASRWATLAAPRQEPGRRDAASRPVGVRGLHRALSMCESELVGAGADRPATGPTPFDDDVRWLAWIPEQAPNLALVGVRRRIRCRRLQGRT